MRETDEDPSLSDAITAIEIALAEACFDSAQGHADALQRARHVIDATYAAAEAAAADTLYGAVSAAITAAMAASAGNHGVTLAAIDAAMAAGAGNYWQRNICTRNEQRWQLLEILKRWTL